MTSPVIGGGSASSLFLPMQRMAWLPFGILFTIASGLKRSLGQQSKESFEVWLAKLGSLQAYIALHRYTILLQ